MERWRKLSDFSKYTGTLWDKLLEILHNWSGWKGCSGAFYRSLLGVVSWSQRNESIFGRDEIWFPQETAPGAAEHCLALPIMHQLPVY
jgi:hypothetical protein